jgi:hypothetical protein
MSVTKHPLAPVIAKYKDHPEFLGTEITHPNQPGAVDDTLLHLTARLGLLRILKFWWKMEETSIFLVIWGTVHCTVA